MIETIGLIDTPTQEQQHTKLSNVSFTKGNLNIQNGFLAIKSVSSHKKNAKILSIDNDNYNEIKQQNQNNEQLIRMNKVFYIDQFQKELKMNCDNVCKEIYIEDSSVNIYALKKLIEITSQHLTSISIKNCTFSENDQFQNIKSSLNNKMLRELNFQYLIKTIKLPEIEKLDIQLKEIQKQNKNTIEKSLTVKEKIDDNQQLFKTLDCDNSSKFAEFENHYKNEIEKKYKNFDQESLAKYLINGPQKNNQEIKDCINDNIVKDIQEYLITYNKYIKQTYKKNVLTIKEESLDDPLALNMIHNNVIKNKQNIKTVLFKETGVLSLENFIKISRILEDVKKLESLAFFSASLQMECYSLIKEIIKNKSFKFVILNRSSFDFQLLQQQISSLKKIKGTITLKEIPTFYGFYILDICSLKLLEFTPYEFCIKDIFLSEQIQTPEELQKYKIGTLIDNQKQYTEDIKKEIIKYQDYQILNFKGISENLITKVYNAVGKEQNSQQIAFQQELERDIKTLIKQNNYYSLVKAQAHISKIIDPLLQKDLVDLCNQNKLEERDDIIIKKDLDYIFLKESQLILEIYGSMSQNQYISFEYPYKIDKQYIQKDVSKEMVKELNKINLQQKTQNLKKSSKSIYLTLSKNVFCISEIYYEGRNIIVNKLIEYEESIQSQPHFYQQPEFQTLFFDILTLISKYHGLSVSVEYMEDILKDFPDIVPIHIQQLSKEKSNVNQIKINGPFEKQLLASDTIVKVKKLYLFKNLIQKNIFESNLNIQEIIFEECNIKNFDLREYKNLKKIQFIHCQLDFPFFFDNLYQSLCQELNKQQIFVEVQGLLDEGVKVELNIKTETVNKVINQNAIQLHLTKLNSATIERFNSVNEKITFEYLKLSTFTQFFGVEISKFEKNLEIQDTNHFVNSKKNKNPDNSVQEIIQQNKQRFKDFGKEDERSFQTFSKELKEFYASNPQIEKNDLFVSNKFDNNLQEDEEKVQRQCIPQCCTTIKSKNHQSENNQKVITREILTHNYDFCFFQTSMFQVKRHPQKVQIRFFKNILIGQSLIYDITALENIQKLDLSDNTFFDSSQVDFVNFLITNSPNLKKLKIKNIQFSNNLSLTFDKINTSLQKLNISNNNFQQIEEVLKYLISVGITSLEKLKLEDIRVQVIEGQNLEKDDKNPNNLSNNQANLINEDQLKIFNQIILNNQSSLKILNIDGDYIDSKLISNCPKLERLTIKNLSKQKYINDFVCSTLKEIRISSSQIQEKILFFFLNNYRDTTSNLQKIKITQSDEDEIVFYSNSIVRNSKDQEKYNQLIEVSKYFEIKPDRDTLSKIMTFTDFISKYKLNIIQINNKDIPKEMYSFIQRVSITKQDSYHSLSKVFQNLDSPLFNLTLKDIQFTDPQLQQLDFSKTLKYVRALDFSGNKDLKSLQFITSVLSNNKQLQIKQLNIKNTSINLNDAINCLSFFREVIWNSSDATETAIFTMIQKDYYPCIQYIYQNIYEQQIIMTLISKILLNKQKISKSEYQFLHKILFHNKIPYRKDLMSNNPLIISHLSPLFTPLNLEKSIEIFKKQNQWVFDNQLISKYQLFSTWFPQEKTKYIFGYNKHQYDPFFYTKWPASILNKAEDTRLSEIQYSYQQYSSLLTQVSQIQNNVENIYLYQNLAVSHDEICNTQNIQDIDEMKIIKQLQKFPSSELTISDMSIQFIKIWYVINCISPLTFKTTIKSHKDHTIYNSSIRNFIISVLNKNNFLNKFLVSASQKYKFDETVFFLAQYFDVLIKKKFHVLLLIIFPLYLFVCIFGVIYFSLDDNVGCGSGISWKSYYFYIAYGVMTFIIELFMFSKCLNYISHLLPSLEIDLNPGAINKMINFIRQIIIDTPWINQWYMGYSSSFFQSQLARFDNFTNVAFLYSMYQCNDLVTFYISLCFICVPLIYTVIEFILILAKNYQKELKLPTASLDKFYMICNILEFKAVSDVLDLVSPSNITTIKGRMFNQRILSNFVRILGESIPLVILQIYNISQNQMTTSLLISLLLSILVFLNLFISLITITPSTLNQEDFNKLNQKKMTGKVVEKYEERLQKCEDEMFVLRFFENLKQTRHNYLSLKNSDTLKEQLEINKKNDSSFTQFFRRQVFFNKFFSSTKIVANHEDTYKLASAVQKTREQMGEFIYDCPQFEDYDAIYFENFQYTEMPSVYTGYMKNGKKSGRGIQTWDDGEIYEGYYKNGFRAGKGRYISIDGSYYYGEYENSQFQGFGILKSDDSIYRGEFVADKQEGYGVETWPDGGKFEGQYVAGKKTGKGKYLFQGGDYYEGHFNENTMHGFGIYKYIDGRSYEGEWKNNYMDGQGIFKFTDGRIYIGTYEKNLKHGYGEFEFPDGRKFLCNWKNGKQDGEGKYVINGKEAKTIMQDGKSIKNY